MSKKTTLKGFTIVELLIVIVVMGILATIVIVTYQGVQDKANTTKNQSNATEVMKKAEAYNALNTGYPASTTVFSADDADATVKLNPEVADLLVSTDVPADPSAAEKKQLYFSSCGSDTDPTGVRIRYWSYDKKRFEQVVAGTDC